MISHIISECSNLAQNENKTKHDWVGKLIHWELCKKLKFDYANKLYMLNPESVQENEMQKLLRVFFLDTNGSPNLGQTTKPSDSQQKRDSAV